jgi:hypothetical protein
LQPISQTLISQQGSIDSLSNVIATIQISDSFPGDTIDSFTANFVFVESWSTWETIEIEAPLVPMIFVVAENPSSYKSSHLILPTNDVTDGYTVAVLNSNHHWSIEVSPMNEATNDGDVFIGTINHFVFYQGVWYPTYVPG